MPSPPSILILSSDALVAALLGALAEYQEMRPVFANGDETAEAALRRVRPAIVLADCDIDACTSDSFLAAARDSGTRVLFFTHRRDRSEIREMAERSGVAWFALPLQQGEFARLLSSARDADRADAS